MNTNISLHDKRKMASACVNNIGMSPDNFLDCPSKFPSYGWLGPRISFSREYSEEDKKLATTASPSSAGIPKSPAKVEKNTAETPETSDPDVSGKDNNAGDFEFRLDDSVTMLPADELFSDGKLVPLHLNAVRPATLSTTETAETTIEEEVRSPEKTVTSCRSREEVLSMSNDPYLFSPKAPRCSSRWRELLGLKKQNRDNNNGKTTTTSSITNNSSNICAATSSSSMSTGRSIRQLLHRSSKSVSSSDPSLILPLLRDSDTESISISSRLSLSSSSSGGHDHDDLPRLSLDSDKPNSLAQISTSRSLPGTHQPRIRLVKPRMVSVSENPNQKPLIDHPSAPLTNNNSSRTNRVGRSPMRRAQKDPSTMSRGVSVDSPRMNSSGKIVFTSLERSSSSPSSYGAPRYKHRGMERSYSANVRVTPVLNVPVCSLRGSSKSGGMFGFFSSSQGQKKDGNGNNSGNGSGGGGNGRSHHLHHHYHGHHHPQSSGRSSKKVERVVEG